MKKKIIENIKRIESEEGVKVLLACETGSRAWGFPSPDSDYDVRMIYVHELNWYLSIYDRKDHIVKMIEDGDLDITGWELKKSLILLGKSNPAFLERIQSPILYLYDSDFLNEMNSLAIHYYSKISTMHHYLSMAKKFVEDIESNEKYKLKTFFYALRTSSICKWIIDRNIIPPIEFKKIYLELDIDKTLVQRINELITLKSTKSESYLHFGESELISFMKSCIAHADLVKDKLPPAKGDLNLLNNLLQKYARKYDY